MRNTLVLLIIAFVTGCGGGGGGSRTPIPAPVEPPPLTFQPGVFPSSFDFQGQCQIPRTGINPETGLAFTDTQGSTRLENFWLRSMSNELYLWYNEIVDQDPDLFNSPLAYFDTLKTLA
ncbi:peptidase, partial [Gammaproteobacteria bacterium]|nr:peptidase [Gammaproteobacteria bacterium]